MKSPMLQFKHSEVMLIDDNEIDNFINEKIIAASCFSSHVNKQTSARGALEFLKYLDTQNAPDAKIPDYIFLDINMPILDGFQFLEEFERFSTKFKSAIKIIMLTTSLNPSDLEKAKSYKQVVKFLHKPLLEADLNSL
jgi:CheY-like chemotaxis protein